MTKTELLARIRQDRGQLDALVARVGEGRMEEPALEGGRSVKDVLAHISAWEKICMALIRNKTPIDPPEPGTTRPSTDVINERIYEASRDQPLEEVEAEARRSYADILALVEGLSDEALAAPQSADGPPVEQLISGNSDHHYREHIAQIERWLGRS